MENTKSLHHKTSLFVLTWPIFVELLLQMLVGNVDQFMLSQYSDTAVAAVGNVNTIMNLLALTFNIVSMATMIMVSQYIGANDKKKVEQTYSVAIIMNFLLSLVVGIGIIAFENQFFAMIQMPKELYADASVYMRIVGFFIFLQAVFMSFSAIFRSNGLMKQTMIISAIINVVNIIGNVIFLNGYFGAPTLGVAGVAISSVLSRFVGLVLVSIIFAKALNGRISLKHLIPFPKDIIMNLLKIGVPSAGESVAYNAVQMWIVTCVNTMGTYVVTTRVYANMMAWFSWIYSSAISAAVQILVGHLIGAKEEDQADQLVMKTLMPTVIITLSISVAVYLGCDMIFGFFTQDSQVLALAKQIMFIEIFLEVGRAINLVIIRSLQAAGDIKFPVGLGIASMCGIAGVFSYVLGISMGLGLVGVWIAMAMDEIIRAVIVYIRWKKGSWRGRSIVAS